MSEVTLFTGRTIRVGVAASHDQLVISLIRSLLLIAGSLVKSCMYIAVENAG